MKLAPTWILAFAALALPGCKGGNRPVVEKAADTLFAPRGGGAPPQPAGPDLTVRDVRYAKLGLAPGETSTVELDLFNRGQTAAGPFRVAVWVSTDSVASARRRLAGSVEVGGLATGATQHAVITFTAPAEARGYAIGVEVDDRKQVAGDDRQNNTAGHERLWVR